MRRTQVRNSESTVTEIIETKIRPPQILKKRLTRKEFDQKLVEAARETGLVSIVAPAGSGKSTTLVDLYESLKAEGTRCFWLSLDAGDDSPSVFARYLTAALYQLDVSNAERAQAFLRAQGSENLNGFFDALIRLIASNQTRFAFFVDDFQVLSHPDIIRFWDRLLSYAPHGMCAVLASRTPLPLDLSRRRVSGTLSELDHRDLNLTPAQITSFMKDLHAIDLPAATAQLLHDKTEGWIVGLKLAGMAINNAKDCPSELLEAFSARDKDLKEYLFQAVYKFLPDEIKDFLLQTSLLAQMSVPLCNAITKSNDSARLMELIESSNLFLIPLDREQKWYRYHHLFSDFLRNELHRDSRFEQKDICMQAADWCIAQGHLNEAVQYCLDASRYDKAADLIAERALSVIAELGDHAMIFDWMRRLPREYHHQRPEILLYHAWSLAFTRDSTATAIALSEEVERLLRETVNPCWILSDREREEHIALTKAIRLVAMACSEQAAAGAEYGDQLLHELAGHAPILKASTAGATSYSNYLLNNFSAAARGANEIYAYGNQAESTYSIVWADALATMVNVELGHIAAAEANATRAQRNAGASSLRHGQPTAIAALIRTEVAVQRCDFEMAHRQFVDGRVLASISNPPEFLLMALRNEARLMVWHGALDNARRSLHQGQETAQRTNQPRLYYALVAEEINLLLHADRFDSAKDTLRRTDILSTENPLINADNRNSIVEYTRLTEAQMHLAENKHAAALQVLTLARRSAQSQGRIMLLQKIGALRSIALWNMGKQKQAAWELDKVISIAAPENHAYPLFSAGRVLLDILEYIQDKRATHVLDDRQRHKHEFENRIVLLLNGSAAGESVNKPLLNTQANGSDLINPLTNRELEILRLIAAGLGNKQLADELLITLSTAKWHVHKIFEKLGVRSRTAAVAYARKYHLV